MEWPVHLKPQIVIKYEVAEASKSKGSSSSIKFLKSSSSR